MYCLRHNLTLPFAKHPQWGLLKGEGELAEQVYLGYNLRRPGA